MGNKMEAVKTAPIKHRNRVRLEYVRLKLPTDLIMQCLRLTTQAQRPGTGAQNNPERYGTSTTPPPGSLEHLDTPMQALWVLQYH